MIKLRKRSLIALALAASAVILGTTSLPANAATGADGFPIVSASAGSTAVHKCAVVGSADGYQGVVCADIIVSEVNTSDYFAYGQIEVYCQKGSGSTAYNVQCAQVDAYGQLASGGGTGTFRPTGELLCGHQYGACSTGRNYLASSPRLPEYNYTSNSGCSTNPNSLHAVWMEVTGGAGIELPVSDKWVTLQAGSGANDGNALTTGHYYICA